MMMTGSFASPAARFSMSASAPTLREREHVAVDDVAALRVDADVDLLRPLLGGVGVGLRQRDLQLGDALVGRRHHEEDQDDEQHVDQRNEVDLGILAGPRAAQVHRAPPRYFRSPCAKSTSLIACCSISTTRPSTLARK